jgi:hypothetical protein
MIENHYCKRCQEGTICQSSVGGNGFLWTCFKCGSKTL